MKDMAERTVRVCDICGAEAQTYKVVFPDGDLSADLCDQHCLPLAKLRSELPAGLFTRAGSRRRGRRMQLDDEV